MLKLKLTPTNQITLFLIVYATFATAFDFQIEKLYHLGETLGLGLVLFAILSRITHQTRLIQNTIITTLIIYLVLHYPLQPIDHLSPILATTAAILAKFFLSKKGTTGINPAVLGLLLAAVVLRAITGVNTTFISWWGASFQGYVSLGLLAIWIALGLYRWRKLPIVFSFLIGNAIAQYFYGASLSSLEFVYTDATIYFLATIMLVEPKTSPFRTSHQIIFGTLAALSLLITKHFGLPYNELFAIAIANTYFGLTKLHGKTQL